MNMSNELRRFAAVGISAMAMTGEKVKEIIDIMSAKGVLIIEQGALLNQPLKYSDKQTSPTCPDNTCVVEDEDNMQRVDHFIPEEPAVTEVNTVILMNE